MCGEKPIRFTLPPNFGLRKWLLAEILPCLQKWQNNGATSFQESYPLTARIRTKNCSKMHHNLLKSIFYMTHFSRTFWRFGNDFISEKTIILVFSQWNKSSGYFLDKARKKVCHALLTYKLRVWRKLMYVFCTVKTTNLFQKWRNFLLRKTRNSFYRNKKFLLPKNKKLPSTENKKFSFYQYEQVSWAIIEANMCQIPWPL